MSHHYLLDENHQPQPVDLLVWAKWFETSDRHVRLTRVGPYTVSTVFMGLDHNFFHQGPPILFETMVMIDMETEIKFVAPRTMRVSFLDIQERCCTWEEALLQHQRVIDQIRESHDDEEELKHGPNRRIPEHHEETI